MKKVVLNHLVIAVFALSAAFTSCEIKDKEPKEYTIKFNSKGGKPDPADVTVKEGDKIPEPPKPTPANGKGTLAGWYTDAPARDYRWDFDAPAYKDMMLYARYTDEDGNVLHECDCETCEPCENCEECIDCEDCEVCEECETCDDCEECETCEECDMIYTVKFISDGSTVYESLFAAGSALSKPKLASREGYIFEGWYKDANFENEWNFATDVVTANVTLYAKWIDDGDDDVAPELIGKWEAQSMIIKYLNFDYEDETVLFPREIEDWDMRPESMGFEFTSNIFKAYANGTIGDEAGVYTEGNNIYVSSTTREYNDFTWQLSGSTLTLTVTLTDEWDGESGSIEYIMTFVYTCEKVTKFSWE